MCNLYKYKHSLYIYVMELITVICLAKLISSSVIPDDTSCSILPDAAGFWCNPHVHTVCLNVLANFSA